MQSKALKNKRKIEFAVIGWTAEEDINKGVLDKKAGRAGLLSWHNSTREAWIACTEINTSGGVASVKRMPNGQLTEETIKALAETL